MKKYEDFDYSGKMAELETVLGKLQSADVALDDAMQLHEQGKALIAELEDFLAHAENTINKQLAKE